VKRWYIPFLNAKYHAKWPRHLARYIPDPDLKDFLTSVAAEDQRSLSHDVSQMESGTEDVGPDLRLLEKEVDPVAKAEALKWRQMGYPLRPGESTPARRDPRVQEGLGTLKTVEQREEGRLPATLTPRGLADQARREQERLKGWKPAPGQTAEEYLAEERRKEVRRLHPETMRRSSRIALAVLIGQRDRRR